MLVGMSAFIMEENKKSVKRTSPETALLTF